MTTIDFKEFIEKNVPNFIELEILEEKGECYHYSNHWNSIQKSGYFKGAKIDKNLDQTQKINHLGKAKDDKGVVFAYEHLKDARDEGFGLDIIKIKYKKALKSLHKAEFELGNLTKQMALENGIDLGEINTPHTIMILTTNIISFEYIEKAPE